MATPYVNYGQKVHSALAPADTSEPEPRGTPGNPAGTRGTPDLLNRALNRGRKRVVAQRAIECRTAGGQAQHLRDDMKGAVAVVRDLATRDDARDLRAEERLQLPHATGQIRRRRILGVWKRSV